VNEKTHDDIATEDFDGRVAQVHSSDGEFSGYLLVRSHRSTAKSRPTESIVSIDLLLARLDAREGNLNWSFSDRADPADYDTVRELKEGHIDWYGEQLAIIWLDEAQSEEVRMRLFT
jgi:hypothetical protein